MNETLPEEVRELTRLLREAMDDFWPRLRHLLREKGVDPQTSWLAECFPDDTDFEYGIIVTADCHTFQFGFDYMNKTMSEGTFTEWEDRTARAAHLGANDNVKQIMRFLGSA